MKSKTPKLDATKSRYEISLTTLSPSAPYKFIVRSSSAATNEGGGGYANIAVLRCDRDASEPRMISLRCRGVQAILHSWDKVRSGVTDAAAANDALRNAYLSAARMNFELGQKS